MPKIAIAFLRGMGPTLAHEALLQACVDVVSDDSGHVIIFLGSQNVGRSVKNPFNVQERREIFSAIAARNGWERIHFLGLRDFADNEAWVSHVRSRLAYFLENDLSLEFRGCDVTVVDANKNGAQSAYSEWFPDCDYVQLPLVEGVNATEVREAWYEGRLDEVAEIIPPETYSFLSEYPSDQFADLVEEYEYYARYHKMQEGYKYPPLFQTADSVVIDRNRVLLIRRARTPGKGLWSLPGGFVDQYEQLLSAAQRELEEETGLCKDEHVGLGYPVFHKQFDAPYRSLRGRVISNAYFFDLDVTRVEAICRLVGAYDVMREWPWDARCLAFDTDTDSPLPKLVAGDDASDAEWVSFSELPKIAGEMFEDHFLILEHFLGRIPVVYDS